MEKADIGKFMHKIVESDAFSHSDISKRLLVYLTESSLRGEKPKEFTIGLEVFNQKADDPASSRVRVYIHKLRKRLDDYYVNEGKDDRIRFFIPKGAYTVKFRYKKDIPKKRFGNKTWILFPVFGILLATSVIICITQKSENCKYKKTVIWNDLITNGKNTIIVAGDFFVFQNDKWNEQEGRVRNIRDSHINSEEHLREYVAQNDSLKMEDFLILDNTPSYMPRDALYSMQYLIPLLDRSNVQFQIILSSNFNWERYYDHNIIYIGAFKNMKSLSLLADKLNIYYDYKNDVILSNYNNEERIYSNHTDGETTIDHTLVAKMPGPADNVILFFTSNNDIGCIAAVKYFTQPDSIRSFQKNHLKDANYFRTLYKASGILKTDVSFHMLEFESIMDSTLHSFWNK